MGTERQPRRWGIDLLVPTAASIAVDVMATVIRRLQRALPSERATLCLLALIGTGHRAYIFWRYSDAVDALIRQNPDWLTWQFLPIRAYQEHFLDSLWYLQQTPPLPHVVFKLAVSLFDWPIGVGRFLCLMQGAITIGTSLLLFGIIARICASRLAAFVLAAAFLLSTDALVLEYNSFGQTFYENLAMLLVTATCRLFMVYADPGMSPIRAVRVAGSMGALAALAALDRASLAYFAAALLPFIAYRPRLRNLAAFALPILLLHGGWVLKNAIVYGYVSVATSSWAGVNATNSLRNFGRVDTFVKYVLDHREDYPPWFTKMLAEVGYVHWQYTFQDYLPLDVKQEEDRIQDMLGGTNPLPNSIGLRLMSDYYLSAMKPFALAHPKLMASKFRTAYALFWQRIGVYGAMFLDPLFVERRDFALFDVVGRLAGEERQYTMTGHWDDKEGHPARFWTFNLAAIDAASILLLHLVLPVVLLADLVRRLTGRRASTGIEVYFLVATFAYSVIVFNNAELGENMRFRLVIEPVIIALAAYCGAVMMRTCRRAICVTTGQIRLLPDSPSR